MMTARILLGGASMVTIACGGSLPQRAPADAPSFAAAACGTDMVNPTCARSMQCVLGRCRVRGTLPMSNRALRLPMSPIAIGWFKLDHAPADPAMTRVAHQAETHTIGLDFAWRDLGPRKIQRAILVIQPSEQCARPVGTVRLDVRRIAHHWSPTRGRPPRLEPGSVSVSRLVVEDRPLRLDVTEWVREASLKPKRFSGFALSISSEHEGGLCLNLDHTGPILDVFYKPGQKKKKTTDDELEKDSVDPNPTFHEVDDD